MPSTPERRRYLRRKVRKAVKRIRNIRYGRLSKFRRTRPFFYKQTVNGTAITGVLSRYFNQTASDAAYGLQFRAVDVDNWSQFSSLYDQYCITKIVLKLIPMLTNNPVQPISGASMVNPGLVGTAIDTDDDSVTATLPYFQQYESFRFQNTLSNRTITRKFVPGIKEYTLTSAGTSVAGATKKKQWLDCANSNVSHYGCKVFIEKYNNANAPQIWQVMAYYYIKFRNVR